MHALSCARVVCLLVGRVEEEGGGTSRPPAKQAPTPQVDGGNLFVFERCVVLSCLHLEEDDTCLWAIESLALLAHKSAPFGVGVSLRWHALSLAHPHAPAEIGPEIGGVGPTALFLRSKPPSSPVRVHRMALRKQRQGKAHFTVPTVLQRLILSPPTKKIKLSRGKTILEMQVIKILVYFKSTVHQFIRKISVQV